MQNEQMNATAKQPVSETRILMPLLRKMAKHFWLLLAGSTLLAGLMVGIQIAPAVLGHGVPSKLTVFFLFGLCLLGMVSLLVSLFRDHVLSDSDGQ